MAKTLPSVPVHDGNAFNWTGKCGVADASDFKGGGDLAGRLYADAADCGFYVSSPSGRKVLFSEAKAEWREGEIVAWHYETSDPDAAGVRIIVFND